MNRNYDGMRELARTINEKAEEFQKLLDKIQHLNDELVATWKGEDATKYTSAISAQANDMKALKRAISSTGEYLSNVVSTYEQAEIEIANSINI